MQSPSKLKSLDLSWSVHLKRLPDFSLMGNLEIISFLGCTSLIEIPTSIQCLERLKVLDLNWCTELRSLPSLIQLKFLKKLNLYCCCNLKMLPQIPRGIEELQFNYSGLEEFSQSVLFLDNFKRFSMFNCKNLIMLPEMIGSLESLVLDGIAIEELPSSIGCLSSLVKLNLTDCKRLKSLPNSISELKCLESLCLSGCSNLGELPPLCGLCSLKELDLNGTALVETPTDIFSFSSLRVLNLNNCKKLQTASSATYIPPIQYEGSWDYHFCNCLNLEQNARSNIMADALRKFEELAIFLCSNVSKPRLSHIIFLVF